MPQLGRYDDGSFFYWCIGKFQIIRYTRDLLFSSFQKYKDEGEYNFFGIGWGPHYFGFFTAGIRRVTDDDNLRERQEGPADQTSER